MSPQSPHSGLNRCNLPPWIIASCEFQERPQPLEIDGARATDYANGQFSVINFINAQINIAHGVGDPNDDG